jgi:hypothetical protein
MNSRKVSGTLLIAIAIACTLGAVVTYREATALRDHGVVVTGSVSRVHEEIRNNYVVVDFFDAHHDVVTAEVDNYLWDPSPHVGDRPRLIYDPRNPTGNVVDARLGPDFFATWASAGGAILAAALAAPTWSGRLDWNKLR